MVFKRGMFDQVHGSEFEKTSHSMQEAVMMGNVVQETLHLFRKQTEASLQHGVEK